MKISFFLLLLDALFFRSTSRLIYRVSPGTFFTMPVYVYFIYNIMLTSGFLLV